MPDIKKSLRKTIIEHKLKEIEESIAVAEDNLPSNLKDFLHLGLIKDGIYKKIEFAIENMVDICSIINSDMALGIPADEDSIINNLEDKKIISKELAEKVREKKGFRNILVHRYSKIDDELAFEVIREGLNDFVLFIKETRRFLERKYI